MFCKVIAAMIVKIGGVYVKDQLAVEKDILFQSTVEYDPVLFHLLKHLRISAVYCSTNLAKDISRSAVVLFSCSCSHA